MGQMATKMLRFVDTRMQTPDKRAAAERAMDAARAKFGGSAIMKGRGLPDRKRD